MISTATPETFHLHRWVNPETTHDYPYIAVAEDGSAVLSLGHYGLSIDLIMPSESEQYLEADFVSMDAVVRLELAGIRYLLRCTFPAGVDFLIVNFDLQLRVSNVQLSLHDPISDEAGPEYRVLGPGQYQRHTRSSVEAPHVSAAERALLEVCVAACTDLATAHPHVIKEPTPPRYRAASRLPSE